jgi:hypothetical protein
LPDGKKAQLGLHVLGLNFNEVLEISDLTQFLYMMMSGSNVLLGEAFQLLTKVRLTPMSGGHGPLKKIEVVIHCPFGLLHGLLDSVLRLNVEIGLESFATTVLLTIGKVDQPNIGSLSLYGNGHKTEFRCSSAHLMSASGVKRISAEGG